MITPARRMWLYPIARDKLEIVILGGREESAKTYARVHAIAEAWPGWSRVETLVQDSAVVGVVVQLGPNATSDDPVAEALRMLRAEDDTLRWSGGGPSDSAIGMVAS